MSTHFPVAGTHKHTPEPWRVGRPTKYGTRSPDTVMTVAKDEDGMERAIAHVYGVPSNCKLEEIKDDPRYAEGLANAHLLAKAPGMLVALKGIYAKLNRQVLPVIELGTFTEDVVRACMAEAGAAIWEGDR